MKKFMLLMVMTIIIFAGTTASELSAIAKTTTYYQTNLTSATGKNYKIALKSSNVKKKIGTIDDAWAAVRVGDQLYKGTFQFYLNGKKTSYKNSTDYNKTRKNFYKINTKKGTPSFLAISKSEGSNIDYIKLYYMYNGTLRTLNKEYVSSLKPKYYKKNVLKTAYYDPYIGKYEVKYIKVNPETGQSKVTKKVFVTKKPW